MEEEESNLYRDAFLEGFTAQIEQLEIEKQVLKTKFSTDFLAGVLSDISGGAALWKLYQNVPSLREITAVGAIGLVGISISSIVHLINIGHEIRGKDRAIGMYTQARDRMEERFFPEGRRI